MSWDIQPKTYNLLLWFVYIQPRPTIFPFELRHSTSTHNLPFWVETFNLDPAIFPFELRHSTSTHIIRSWVVTFNLDPGCVAIFFVATFNLDPCDLTLLRWKKSTCDPQSSLFSRDCSDSLRTQNACDFDADASQMRFYACVPFSSCDIQPRPTIFPFELRHSNATRNLLFWIWDPQPRPKNLETVELRHSTSTHDLPFWVQTVNRDSQSSRLSWDIQPRPTIVRFELRHSTSTHTLQFVPMLGLVLLHTTKASRKLIIWKPSVVVILD